ncbi:MAG: hypothetical protein Fur0019_17360 [Tibeticola sp.]
MAEHVVSLSQAALVLGCDKATVSRIRAGAYDKASDIPRRYEALVALIERVRREAALDENSICMACPREDCAGCRIAEM